MTLNTITAPTKMAKGEFSKLDYQFIVDNLGELMKRGSNYRGVSALGMDTISEKTD